MSRHKVDVCVVGSGAGGSMVALRLAQAGARVQVLERGPQLKRQDFVADELYILGPGRLRPDPRTDPHTFRIRAGMASEASDAGWTACCVGGATVIYGGVSLRLRPRDFRLRSELGEIRDASLADWPISYTELEPYYGQAERLLGVSGDVSTNPFEPIRREATLLPPVADKPGGAVFDRGAVALGLHPYRVPLAVLSRPSRDRPACTGCGFCSRSGCPIGAKSSAPEAVLPLAVATGNCEITAQARVFEVAIDGRGRARWVRYLDQFGHGHEIEADVVVLACGAIESARLLLLSRSKAFPEGLANGSGLVGKNLTFHVVPEIGGFVEPAIFLHRGAPTTRALDDYYDLPPTAGTALGGVLLLADGMGPVQFALERTGWGHAHAQAMARYGQHIRLFGIVQDLPRECNDVTLDPGVRDSAGLAVARITHENHPLDRLAARFIAQQADALLAAAGAKERYREVPDNTCGDAHQHGTCRFGEDPKKSVLDRDCAAHDVPNLFVVDGSFMPTPGGVNPALTIQANALRVADRIWQRSQSRRSPTP
jgi:choline dehydrogenase-like flavoprotein